MVIVRAPPGSDGCCFVVQAAKGGITIASASAAPHLTTLTATRLSAETPSGDDRTRTDDPLLAKQVLYQLSYVPATTELRPRDLRV